MIFNMIIILFFILALTFCWIWLFIHSPVSSFCVQWESFCFVLKRTKSYGKTSHISQNSFHIYISVGINWLKYKKQVHRIFLRWWIFIITKTVCVQVITNANMAFLFGVDLLNLNLHGNLPWSNSWMHKQMGHKGICAFHSKPLLLCSCVEHASQCAQCTCRCYFL